MNIPVQDYLNYALSLKEQEKNLISDFENWLPIEIIDCHAHANAKYHCIYIDEYLRTRLTTTFPWFEIPDHIMVNKILYPNKKIRMLLFPFPYRGINHRAANKYIAFEATYNRMVIPILCGLPNDIDYTITNLETGVFCGLKMYPAYTYPPAQQISDYFPGEILSFLDSCKGVIILHLPRHIAMCLDDILTTAERFPRLKIILAHMGLADLPTEDLCRAFNKLAPLENVFLDTSFITSVEVFKTGLNIFGHRRILFGTDQPLNLIRGRIYSNPRFGARIATDYPYHWVDPEEQHEFSRYAVDTVHIHWEMLVSLREAIRNYGETDEVKCCIFAENAKRIFRFNTDPG